MKTTQNQVSPLVPTMVTPHNVTKPSKPETQSELLKQSQVKVLIKIPAV